jgi:hypothetical protein
MFNSLVVSPTIYHLPLFYATFHLLAPLKVDEMANRLNDLAPSKVASFYLLFFIFREIFGALLIKK